MERRGAAPIRPLDRGRVGRSICTALVGFFTRARRPTVPDDIALVDVRVTASAKDNRVYAHLPRWP